MDPAKKRVDRWRNSPDARHKQREDEAVDGGLSRRRCEQLFRETVISQAFHTPPFCETTVLRVGYQGQIIGYNARNHKQPAH
jgi:hypothetical protein